MATETCGECNGSGKKKLIFKCKNCNGTGRVHVPDHDPVYASTDILNPLSPLSPLHPINHTPSVEVHRSPDPEPVAPSRNDDYHSHGSFGHSHPHSGHHSHDSGSSHHSSSHHDSGGSSSYDSGGSSDSGGGCDGGGGGGCD